MMYTQVLSRLQSWTSISNLLYFGKWAFLLFWLPGMLFLLFFAPLPAVHDQLHSFRHAFSMIGCH